MNEDTTPKTRRRKKTLENVDQLPVKSGLVLDTCQSGVYVVPAVAAKLGLVDGDYLEIECDDRGTKIVRQFCSCDCFRGGRAGFVYMDGESASYLNVQPHQEVIIRKSAYQLSVP